MLPAKRGTIANLDQERITVKPLLAEAPLEADHLSKNVVGKSRPFWLAETN
jgi:hypothetical protein